MDTGSTVPNDNSVWAGPSYGTRIAQTRRSPGELSEHSKDHARVHQVGLTPARLVHDDCSRRSSLTSAALTHNRSCRRRTGQRLRRLRIMSIRFVSDPAKPFTHVAHSDHEGEVTHRRLVADIAVEDQNRLGILGQ